MKILVACLAQAAKRRQRAAKLRQGAPVLSVGSLQHPPGAARKQAERPGAAFPRRHEGHSGWTISTANSSSGSTAGIAALVPSPAFDTGSGGIPHIILLHIGTNDANASSGQSEMSNRLAALLDKIIAAAPDTLLVVAKITPLASSSGNAWVNTYNNAIPGLVQTRADAGKHIVLADMNTGFTSSMLSPDGIHPTQAAYIFMGDRWHSVIGSLLR